VARRTEQAECRWLVVTLTIVDWRLLIDGLSIVDC
jgi:hypothetical protein